MIHNSYNTNWFLKIRLRIKIQKIPQKLNSWIQDKYLNPMKNEGLDDDIYVKSPPKHPWMEINRQRIQTLALSRSSVVRRETKMRSWMKNPTIQFYTNGDARPVRHEQLLMRPVVLKFISHNIQGHTRSSCIQTMRLVVRITTRVLECRTSTYTCAAIKG